MKKIRVFALFLIATSALSAWAQGQKVYRCGATYSQTPCAQGVALEVQDARTPEQKLQADQATVRDVTLANTLEKDRLQAQAQAHAAVQQQARAAADKPPAPKGKKSPHKKKKAPEFFAVPPTAEPAAKTQPGTKAHAKALKKTKNQQEKS